MTILYKNVKKKLQTSDTTILTPDNATTAIIKSIIVCEQSNNGETLNLTITDTADTPVTFQLFKDKSISAKTTVELLTEPLVLAEQTNPLFTRVRYRCYFTRLDRNKFYSKYL